MSVLDAPYLVDPLKATTRGFRELVLGAQPAAAADFVQVIEGRYVTRLLAVHCNLDTDANAANREVVLSFEDDQGVRFALNGAPVTVSANDVTDYAFMVGLGQPDWPSDDTILVPLSPYFLLPGWRFALRMVNAAAGDQLSAIRIFWERYWSDEAH